MRIYSAIIGIAAMIAVGCSSGSPQGNPDAVNNDLGDADSYSVDTAVSAASVSIGQAVTVTCTVNGPTGVFQTATTITVTPAEGWTLDGTSLTFSQTGEFQVACSAPDVSATDETPATVTVSEGRAASVDTAVAPASIVAGASATATCTSSDAYGNPASGATEIRVTPAEGVVVTAGTTAGTFKIEGRTVGSYAVACALLADGTVDGTPASLAVTPADMTKIVTLLDGDTTTAGVSMPGKCKAFDAYGNELTGIEFGFDVPADLTVTNSPLSFSVMSTKAGTYDITCKAADGSPAALEKDTLKVEAGPSVGITLKLIPEKPVYLVTNQVKVGFDLVDAYQNPIPGGAITPPTVEPPTGTTAISTDEFQFDAEGKFTFHACDATNATLCDDVEAWCDGSAPVLAITYPPRGATIDGDRSVVVTGTVTEATSQVKSLIINGQTIEIGADGSFQFPIIPEQGMNLIDATATDTFDNEYRTLRSFLYSSSWYPMDQPDNPLAGVVPNAIKAYLDDKLFFNADATDEATISAILQMALADLDIGSLLPPGPITTFSQKLVFQTCTYDIYLDSLTFGPPTTELTPDFGALLIHAVVPNLKVDLRLISVGSGFPCPGDQAGTATATAVVLDSKINMDVDPATHLIRMSAGTSTLTLDGFDVQIDSWFYNLIIGLLKGTLENMLKDQVQTLLTDLISSLPQTLNDALAKPIEFTVPELLAGMNAVTLRFSLQPETIGFTPEGGAVDINAAINADHTIDRTILGSIGRASCLAGSPEAFGFDMANPEKLALALFDDVLNEALYSLWGGRFLNVHLTSESLGSIADLTQYGVENLDATTQALIPPVITSCNPAGTLTVQVGDLYLDASMNLMGEAVHMHTFLFLGIEMNLALAEDPEKGPVIAITIGDPPKLVDMDFELFESDYYSQSEIKDLFIVTMLPIVFQQLAAKPITFAIPSFNLASLAGSSLPITLPNKDLVIVPKALQHDKGYLDISADLELRDPVVVPPTP